MSDFPPAIEVSHLVKTYAGVTAVSDISFTVARGEIIGFLGPNGAGKSTTMRILTGYLPATSGSVSICGVPVATQGKPATAGMPAGLTSTPSWRERVFQTN